MTPLPKLEHCPACAGKLTTQFQKIEVMRRDRVGWGNVPHKIRRRRRVCTKCNIAVVVHRLHRSKP